MLKSGSELRLRDLYLNRLIAFQDTEPVKIITGIRRCGKSSLMKLMILHLRDTGVADDQIIEMNFESMDFRRMTVEELYRYVKERLPEKKRAYLFFDEIQRIDQWQDAVNSFRVDFDCDIYVTGSNAYLLSSEYATYLAGSFWTSTAIRFGRAKAPPEEYGSGSTMPTARAMSPRSCWTPICASAECPGSQMWAWIPIRR